MPVHGNIYIIDKIKGRKRIYKSRPEYKLVAQPHILVRRIEIRPQNTAVYIQGIKLKLRRNGRLLLLGGLYILHFLKGVIHLPLLAFALDGSNIESHLSCQGVDIIYLTAGYSVALESLRFFRFASRKQQGDKERKGHEKYCFFPCHIYPHFCLRGIVITNVVPSFSLLETFMLPLCISTAERVMESPSPVPPVSLSRFLSTL